MDYSLLLAIEHKQKSDTEKDDTIEGHSEIMFTKKQEMAYLRFKTRR